MIRSSSDQQEDSPAVVLYVSDDSSYINTVRRNLGHTGFSVVTTRSATQAIEMISESQFDAVLSDYNLPQMDAITLLEKVQEQNNGKSPPLLVITEHRTEPIRAQCISAGTAGIHTKKESVELLIERVTSMLENDAKREQIVRSASKRRFQGSNDPLTQIANKQHFTRRMKGESVAAYRDQTGLSVLLITVDKFDKVLDQHGQSKSDGTLVQVARLIEGELRSRDCVARYADHSFAIVLPDSNVQAATAVGRRLRHRISTSQFGDLDTPISITVSVGAANRPAGVQIPPDEIMIQAIHTSQAAEKMGGNRVLSDNALTGSPLVLVLGDPTAESGAVARVLEDTNVEVRMATSFEEARNVLEEIPVAMVMADEEIAGSYRGVDLLSWLKNRFPNIKRVLMSTRVDQDLMTKAINRASIDYFIPIPGNLANLPVIVDELLFS